MNQAAREKEIWDRRYTENPADDAAEYSWMRDWISRGCR
jgi:hypothetical protein